MPAPTVAKSGHHIPATDKKLDVQITGAEKKKKKQESTSGHESF
jgi:hypothetical protein